MSTPETQEKDGRLSFMEGVAYVMQRKQPVFAAMPVFGETEDEEQTAEGAKIFIIESDPEDAGDWQMRFIAGPFFSTAFAANEVIPPAEVPASVRDLRFMPTRVEEEWFSDQIQILIQKLVQAANIDAQIPDYENAPAKAAGPEAVFPMHFIKGGREPH